LLFYRNEIVSYYYFNGIILSIYAILILGNHLQVYVGYTSLPRLSSLTTMDRFPRKRHDLSKHMNWGKRKKPHRCTPTKHRQFFIPIVVHQSTNTHPTRHIDQYKA